ncbi:hypothetical protein FA13DRAFT_960935 [Coprinellus micaceus]|uniref:Uncharacterized protein n=1 Tax=Coprinellus micaceus TaxID=71717 RepID=A0A4Y7SZT3_COPMI|nr:hypothetical protein FA13DRAFT_960935 [Coprinellus micaceus]
MGTTAAASFVSSVLTAPEKPSVSTSQKAASVVQTSSTTFLPPAATTTPTVPEKPVEAQPAATPTLPADSTPFPLPPPPPSSASSTATLVPPPSTTPSTSAIPSPSASSLSQANVPSYMKFVKDLSSAFGNRLDGAVVAIIDEVKKVEALASQAATITSENVKQSAVVPTPSVAPEVKQILEALLGLLEGNTRLRELVGSHTQDVLMGVEGLAAGQKKEIEKREKMEGLVEGTWGVVNYVETMVKDVKDNQTAFLNIITPLAVSDENKAKLLASLQSKLDGVDKLVGEFRAEVVSRFQAADSRGEELSRKQAQQIQAVGEYRKEVGALRSMLEELERRRVESERKAEERERKREVEEVRRGRAVEEAREAAVRSEKAVEGLRGEVRMMGVERSRTGGKEAEPRYKIVSEAGVQAELGDMEMGDVQAEERQRKAAAASKAKKVLDVMQHMADLPGLTYNDDDDIASSDDGVVAVRTRGVSAKGKEREVAVVPAAARKQAQVVSAPQEQHSESTLLALMLDEFRLIKDKLTASERRAREETASTKLLHRAEMDTLRSDMDRTVEEERRRRELETRLERERLDREKDKAERLEREKLERLERLEKGERERVERERAAAERLERERAEMFERAERERKEMLERVEKIERERAEWERDLQRERIEWEREKMEWEKEKRAVGLWAEESGPPSMSQHPHDTEAEVAELRRRLAYYESRGSVPPLPHRESSSASASAPPQREESEPFHPPLPSRRDRSSSIASSSNNVEAAKRPTINTNVAMEVDGAVSLHVPAKAQRKMMRTHHGNMPPPSGEP